MSLLFIVLLFLRTDLFKYDYYCIGAIHSISCHQKVRTLLSFFVAGLTPTLNKMAAPIWTNALFGCCSNKKTCLCAFCCPPCLYHTNAARVDTPCGFCLWFVPGLNFFCFAKTRGKIRDQKNIIGGLVGDCVVHCCCHCCALAQEKEELDWIDAHPVITGQPRPGVTVVVRNS